MPSSGFKIGPPPTCTGGTIGPPPGYVPSARAGRTIAGMTGGEARSPPARIHRSTPRTRRTIGGMPRSLTASRDQPDRPTADGNNHVQLWHGAFLRLNRPALLAFCVACATRLVQPLQSLDQPLHRAENAAHSSSSPSPSSTRFPPASQRNRELKRLLVSKSRFLVIATAPLGQSSSIISTPEAAAATARQPHYD